MALAGKRQFDCLGCSGRYVGNVGKVVTSQQGNQFRIAIEGRLKDILLLVGCEIFNTFGDIASVYGFESEQDFLVIITELEYLRFDRPYN